MTYQIDELIKLIEAVQFEIDDDYRAFEDDDEPGIQLTVAANSMKGFESGEWSYQTGDNSYTGGAYGYANWAVIGVYRDTDPKDAALDLKGQLEELCCEY